VLFREKSQNGRDNNKRCQNKMRIWKKLRKYFYINRGQRIANQEALSTMSYFDKTSVGSVTKPLFP
jgi:hypothetical protein